MWLALTLACAVLGPTMTPDALVPWAADDGWTGTVRHYRPVGAPLDAPPVLLVHGMGANHANFDFRPEVSLAAYLAERGWDVWVPELRGDPGAVAPSRRAARRWTFDDLALRDVPAVLDAVQGATGRDQVTWVGHSMGGMLLYTTLATTPDRVAAGVAIASPATLAEPAPIYGLARALRWALGGSAPLPVRPLGRGLGALGKGSPVLRTLANPDNVDRRMAVGLLSHALTDLPRPLGRQVVAWVRAGALVRVDGAPWLPDSLDTDAPVLLLGASVDRIVPAANVAAGCDRIPRCRYELLGVEGGYPRDYGHVDAVVGTDARDVLYPRVAAFLEAQR